MAKKQHCQVEMGMGKTGIPWDSHGNGNDAECTVGMGITLWE